MRRNRKINRAELSASIRKFRESKGMTREEFAFFLGVDVRTIGHWETGKHMPTEFNASVLVSEGWEGLNECS